MKTRENANVRILFRVSLSVLVIFTCIIQGASDSVVKKAMFAETDQLLDEAKKFNADILAPTAYANALQNYRKAEAEFEKGNSLAAVRRSLSASTTELEKALKNARLAILVFGIAYQARNDAVSAEANLMQIAVWQQAEKKFNEAATTLEKDNLNAAKKKGEEAEALYRQAELQAIKINYLNEAYRAVDAAELNKAAELAPLTLKKAKSMIKDAENLLNSDRYDTDQARILARQARREARHALYLTRLAQNIKTRKLSQEEVLLASEAPLRRIASRMDLNLTYEEGFSKSLEEITKGIDDQKQQNITLKNDLFDSRNRSSILAARTRELEEKIGMAETEKSAMSARLEAQARMREKYNAVQAMFSPDEVIVLREGNDLRVRLTGLSFAVGKSDIESQYYPFLRKVIQVLAMFPDAEVVVEGHTDSFGSDAFNLELSQDRAENVTGFLLTNAQFKKEKFEAVGYGESRPIASNETDEGRFKNRRIAVIIHPDLPETE